MALAGMNRLAEGIGHLARAVELAPNDLEARRALALAHRVQGDVEAAVRAFHGILERHPDDVEALVNVARIRATQVDAAHRDGAEAVRCAERARDLVQEPFAYLYGALAAAYAETGRFDEAVQAATRAVELSRKEGDAAATARYEAQLAEHRAGRPFRVP
jgi:tetratricopeptide (TPR) repeat protein